MKTLTTAIVAAIGLTVSGIGTGEAEAASPFGIHFGGNGFHIDIGNVHHGRSYRGYGGHYGSRHVTRYYGGHHSRGHYDWHDTTHYDWHPTEIYRHGNHFHVQPGHYDLHRSGHYDYHRGPHYGGHGFHHRWSIVDSITW